MNNFKKFFAKVLIFGEYTVLYGGNALAAPLKNLYATWEPVDVPEDTYSSLIKNWCSFIDQQNLPLDTSKIMEDWCLGYRFVTDIPTGYGIGSSGVLTAMFYDHYKTEDASKDISVVKSLLGKIESFFHGQSSGLDPLISYNNSALMVNENKVQKIENIDLQNFNMYLLDSGMPRSTAQWVNAFKEKSATDPHFHETNSKRLKEVVNQAIDICTGQVSGHLEPLIEQISTCQREAWSWMIPSAALTRWDEVNALKHTYVKFCGAGGGGYFLVFSKENIDERYEYLKKIEL